MKPTLVQSFLAPSMSYFVELAFPHNSAFEARVANNLVQLLPQKALDIIRGGNFAGGDLVLLKSEVHRPSFPGGVLNDF